MLPCMGGFRASVGVDARNRGELLQVGKRKSRWDQTLRAHFEDCAASKQIRHNSS